MASLEVLSKVADGTAKVLGGLAQARSLDEPTFRAAEAFTVANAEEFKGTSMEEPAVMALLPALRSLVFEAGRAGWLVSKPVERLLRIAERSGIEFDDPPGPPPPPFATRLWRGFLSYAGTVGKGMLAMIAAGGLATAMGRPESLFPLWLVLFATIVVTTEVRKSGGLHLRSLRVWTGQIALAAGAAALAIAVLPKAAAAGDVIDLRLLLGRAYLEAGRAQDALNVLPPIRVPS